MTTILAVYGAGIAVVEAIKKAGGTNTEKLIAAMGGELGVELSE